MVSPVAQTEKKTIKKQLTVEELDKEAERQERIKKITEKRQR